MTTTCPTTEAALQAGLLPAQERREGRFAKVSACLVLGVGKFYAPRQVSHAYGYAALTVPTGLRQHRTHAYCTISALS